MAKMPDYMKLSPRMAKFFKLSKKEHSAVNKRRQKMFETSMKKYGRR